MPEKHIKTGFSPEVLNKTLLKSSFDRFYLVNINTKICAEYTTADLQPVRSVNYDSWLNSLSKNMQRIDSIDFLDRMSLPSICGRLNASDSRHDLVCLRFPDQDTVKDCAFQISFLNQSQNTLALIPFNLAGGRLHALSDIDELIHMKERFQFLVENVVVNFIEVLISTGECRMFHRDSGMKSHRMFRDQIHWWANHFVVPEERVAYLAEFDLQQLLKTLRTQNGIYRCTYTVLRNGMRCSLSIVCALYREKNGGQEEYIYAYVQDVTLLKEQEQRNKQLVDISQQLISLSQTEALTGLYNRAAGEKFIEEYLLHANEQAGTMLLIDIDHFKLFNDQYGHQMGDYVLSFLGKTMQDVFRSDDILCRWGGDEFIVFMRDIHQKNNVESRIERLRGKMSQCRKAELLLNVTISIGACTAGKNSDLKTLFLTCDQALYEVKAQGRNGYCLREI